jgi:hypothetical protein
MPGTLFRIGFLYGKFLLFRLIMPTLERGSSMPSWRFFKISSEIFLRNLLRESLLYVLKSMLLVTISLLKSLGSFIFSMILWLRSTIFEWSCPFLFIVRMITAIFPNKFPLTTYDKMIIKDARASKMFVRGYISLPVKVITATWKAVKYYTVRSEFV